MKEGDKIVCIHTHHRFTEGKTYKVCVVFSFTYKHLGISDDLNINVIPNWDFFTSIKNYRKIKLQKIENGI